MTTEQLHIEGRRICTAFSQYEMAHVSALDDAPRFNTGRLPVNYDALLIGKQHKEIVAARNVIFYVMWMKYPKLRQHELSRAFGRRMNGSVVYGMKYVSSRCKTDKSFSGFIDQLLKG